MQVKWISFNLYLTLHRSRTRELPGNYPFYVQLTYIDAFTQKWRQPAFDLATAVYDELGKQLKALAQKHFHGFGRGLLEQRIKTILLQWARECLTRTEEKIQWLLEVESRPYSLNTAYLKNYQAGFLEYYRDARNTQHNQLRGWRAFNSSNAQRDTYIANAIAALERLNLTVVPNELYRLLPQDMYEPALKIMSDVRAYFQGMSQNLWPFVFCYSACSVLQALHRQHPPGHRSGTHLWHFAWDY